MTNNFYIQLYIDISFEFDFIDFILFYSSLNRYSLERV